ncbi:ATP-binding protein [Falsiroseomonas sp. E2-1-a20]|uniref:ATP-binding protein n=1 Tax=Falsiroseomonas sp. E2-1-a20 TaxID=3239300 RepID=UPI003F3C5353
MLLGGVLVSALAWTGAAWFATQRHDAAEREALATAMRASMAAQRLAGAPVEAAMAILSEVQAPTGGRDRGLEVALAGRLGRDGLQFAAITDATGIVLWSSHPSLRGRSLAERPAFTQHQACRGEMLLTPALLDLPGGPRSLLLSRPLAGAQGRFAGIAVVALDPRRLDLALSDAALLPGLRLALLRPDGTPLAQSGGPGRAAPAAWPQPPRSGPPVLHPAGDGLPALALATAPLAQDLLVVAAYDPDLLLRPATEAGWLGFLSAFLLSVAALGVPLGRRLPLPGAQPAEELLPAVGYRGLLQPDGGLRLTRIGAGIERLTGWSVEAALRPGWRQRGMDAGSQPVGPELEERLRREATAATEYRFRRADGAWMWLRETLRVLHRRPEGIEVSGALEDISAERELALQAATSAKFATLGEMAAGLAHELNQPIAIMSLAAENAAEALEAGEDGVEEALVRLRRIMAQADRAKAIVTQLRAFSRVDVAALEPVDLGAAVQGMMVLAGQALRDAGIQVQLRLPDVLPPVIGQIILVEQVLLNLVLNARDALLERPADRRRLRIEAEAGTRDAPETVTIRVLDSGPGLTSDTLEKLFEPFYTTKPPGLGTGLGLSISRTIMRGLGGHILAANAPDGSDMGAEFTLVFRRAALPATERSAVDPARQLADAPSPRWPAAT